MKAIIDDILTLVESYGNNFSTTQFKFYHISSITMIHRQYYRLTVLIGGIFLKGKLNH